MNRTRNGTAAALALGSRIEANNVLKSFQHAKIAETLMKELTEQVNAGTINSKDVQDAQKCMNIDSKVDSVIIENKDNCKNSVAILIQAGLHKRIKVLEAKKTIMFLEIKLFSLEEKKVHSYCVVNTFMPKIISFKDIFVIEQGQICLNSPKYGGKSMRYFIAYKRVVKYILDVQPFTYSFQQE